MNKSLKSQLVEIEKMLMEVEAKELTPRNAALAKVCRQLADKLWDQIINSEGLRKMTPEEFEAGYLAASPETQRFVGKILEGMAKEANEIHSVSLRWAMPLMIENGFTESEVKLMSGGELKIHLETIADKMDKKKRLEAK